MELALCTEHCTGFKRTGIKGRAAVAQWLVLLPHSEQIPGSTPWWCGPPTGALVPYNSPKNAL